MNYAFYLGRSRTLAAMVLVAVAATSLGFSAWIQRVEAANVIQFSDTLSDSDLGVTATHTVVFTSASAYDNTETINILFDPDGDAFDFTALTAGNVTVTALSGTINQVANVGACSGGASELYVSVTGTIGSDEGIQLTLCGGDTIATSTTFQVQTNNTPVNPSSAGSYVVRIGGTIPDNGDTRVVIIDDVTVTASVETIFTFSINAVNASTTVNDETVSTTGTTTATTVPFGTLAPGVPKFLAQELRVDTNALNGFNVTVEADQTLTAGNLATIDEFIDGAGTGSSTDWVSPTNTFGSPDTYGHWGLTSDDDETGSSTLVYGDSETYYVGNFIQNPIPVFYHDAASSYTNSAVTGESFTRVGYKIEIGTLQEAGTDYQATLTYVATPVF